MAAGNQTPTYKRMPDTEPPTPAEISAWRPPLRCAERFAALVRALQQKVALFMSIPMVALLTRLVSSTMQALNPVSDGGVAFTLWETNNPRWAGTCVFFMVFPLLVLTLAVRSDETYHSAFTREFGCGPSPPSIFLLDLKILGKMLCGGLLTVQEETYVKLRQLVESLTGAAPWTWFQLYIAARQLLFPSVKLVNPVVVCISVLLSVNTVRSTLSYLRTYSGIATGGSMRDFLKLMLRLGDGAAAPSLLMRLRSSQHVVIEEDLSRLSPQGLVSIFAAIETSPVLRTCEFRNTKLVVPGEQWWPGYCCVKFCGNRQLLTEISFRPALALGRNRWNFENAMTLDRCIDGEEVLYDKATRFPATKLRLAVEADDEAGIRAALQAALPENLQEFRDREFVLAAMLNKWRSLAVILADQASRVQAAANDAQDCIQLLLCHAIANDAQDCIQLLLFSKALPDAAPSKGKYHSLEGDRADFGPLHYAAERGYLASMRLLLADGADPNLTHNGSTETPLDVTSWDGQVGAAKLLLEARADVAQGMGEGSGWTNLARCAQNNYAGLAQVLIEAKADIERPWSAWGGGVTPVQVAGKFGNFEVMKVLVAAKADIHRRSSDGRSVLGFVEDFQKDSMGGADCAKLLRDIGAQG